MRYAILLALAAPLTLASNYGFTPLSTLLSRSVNCASGDIVCGSTCIPQDYTCCPDLAGGCPSDSVCQQGNNNVYGCCPVGEICEGDGGAQFINASGTATSSSASATSTATAASTTSKGAANVVGANGAFLMVALAAGGVLL